VEARGGAGGGHHDRGEIVHARVGDSRRKFRDAALGGRRDFVYLCDEIQINNEALTI